MNHLHPRVTAYALTIALAWMSTNVLAGDHVPALSFDLPPTAVAVPVDLSDRMTPTAQAGESVQVNLRLSSMVSGSKVPTIDRWMVQVVPRAASWRVLDYSPRTETGSDYASPIQVKRSDETTSSFGMAADGGYGHLASAHLGADHGGKQSEAIQFDKQAPLHAVSAAGTIQRGRGVYYKLRWTSQQVLEGEKNFQVSFDVPPGFRAGMLDVVVMAYGKPAKSNPITGVWSDMPFLETSSNSTLLGKANFTVAVHRNGDDAAWQLARQLAAAEVRLRQAASGHRADTSIRSLPTLIRHVAAKIDVDSVDIHGDWAERLIAGTADPYVDPVIRKLPADLRVIALDYCDSRRALLALDQPKR
ncbi:hypothetical protein LOC71_22075 [Rhodopirellula sp. JC740]|uniref:Uncharacterized protein n=1 Tax=Rhodopirellula halodulae TaxID=2894198 RepID=A0ABS8NN05_9BACT|nr:hypothetical protein [Rhodopirellula sp. JC740]MCC9644974.1 hypothetical protein [Rhodopirellula sp. JC740]